MQKILINSGKFVFEHLIQVLDDSGVTFHGQLQVSVNSDYGNCNEKYGGALLSLAYYITTVAIFRQVVFCFQRARVPLSI